MLLVPWLTTVNQGSNIFLCPLESLLSEGQEIYSLSEANGPGASTSSLARAGAGTEFKKKQEALIFSRGSQGARSIRSEILQQHGTGDSSDLLP
jgi:hypothetical protein